MSVKKQAYRTLGNTMIRNFKKRNIDAYYFDTSADAVAFAMELMNAGGTVTMGGTETIKETGLLDQIKEAGHLTFLDRSTAQTPEEMKELYRKAFFCDYYLMSANAITIDGELINIDGNGNRVACLIYGPDQVLVVAGMNKVVETVESGLERIGTFAAPPNATRLNLKTPCAATGHCGDCHSDSCMCCQIVVTRHSRQPGRIKVLLVGEELGF